MIREELARLSVAELVELVLRLQAANNEQLRATIKQLQARIREGQRLSKDHKKLKDAKTE